MSLTRKLPELQSNPARRYHKVKAGAKQGHIEWFEKTGKDAQGKTEGTNHVVDFSKGKGMFILDYNMFSVTGWNDDEKFSIGSNEVRSINPETGQPAGDILTIVKYPQRGQKSIIVKGPYAKIKDQVTSKEVNGNYTLCIYFMSEDGFIDHLQLHGASVAAWLEFYNKGKEDIHSKWVKIKPEWLTKSRGQTDYKVPVFEYGSQISDDDLAKASELDHQLQEYLDGYIKRTQGKNAGSDTEDYNQEASYPEGQEEKPANEKKDLSRWRDYVEQGKPPLGSLSIKELIELQEKKEAAGEYDNLYDHVSKAVFDYNEMIKTGSWKLKQNKAGQKLGDMDLDTLNKMLGILNSKDPSNEAKLYIEAAIAEREAEAGPNDDEIPF